MRNQPTSNNLKQIFRHFTVPSLTLKNFLSCIVTHQKQTYELQFVNSQTENSHCVKSVEIRRYFCPYFPVEYRIQEIQEYRNTGKYGPKLNPNLGTFHAVSKYLVVPHKLLALWENTTTFTSVN